MSRAERGVDDGDVIFHPIVDDPLKGLLVAGIGDVLIVVHAQRDEACAGRDSLIFCAIEGVAIADGDGRQAGAVAIGVHGIRIVGDEVVAAEIFSLEGGMVVVGAGVDEDDRLASAVVLAEVGGGEILIDQLRDGAPRRSG